ncbi:MAG: hypothetical protein AAB434_12120 [Planctomycetota bacterium]
MSDDPLLPVRVLHSEPALGKIRALAVTGDGPLWAGADSGMVVEFDFEGVPLRRFHAHKGGVTCLAIAKGVLVSGGNDGHVRIWSTESLACLSQLSTQARRIGRVRLDMDQGVVWALARNGSFAQWRLNGEPLLSVDCEGAAQDHWRVMDGIADLLLDSGSAVARTGDVTWIAGRDANRAGVLTRRTNSISEEAQSWRLPYAVACLTPWKGEGTLYAGGNGRLFAIDLPAP